MSEHCRSSVVIDQQMYKLATVISFICDNGHKYYVNPEKIDNRKPNSSANFKINFYFVIAMQLLGKGLSLMTTFLGLLSICVHHSNYNIWKKIQDRVGEMEQKLALECCKENLQKEVEATIATGILPDSDGCVGITCSGDMGWQGNGSQCTYNSQSGQTTLCGGLTKKVVAFKYFSKLCRVCSDFEKTYLLPTTNSNFNGPVDVPTVPVARSNHSIPATGFNQNVSNVPATRIIQNVLTVPAARNDLTIPATRYNDNFSLSAFKIQIILV